MKSGKKISVPVPTLDPVKLRAEVDLFNSLCRKAPHYDVKDLEILESGVGADWGSWFRQFPFVTSQDPENLPDNSLLYRQISGVLGIPLEDLVLAISRIYIGVYDYSNKVKARSLLDDSGKSTGLAWYKHGNREYYVVLRDTGVLYQPINADSDDSFFDQLKHIKINKEAINAAKEKSKKQ